MGSRTSQARDVLSIDSTRNEGAMLDRQAKGPIHGIQPGECCRKGIPVHPKHCRHSVVRTVKDTFQHE